MADAYAWAFLRVPRDFFLDEFRGPQTALLLRKDAHRLLHVRGAAGHRKKRHVQIRQQSRPARTVEFVVRTVERPAKMGRAPGRRLGVAERKHRREHRVGAIPREWILARHASSQAKR